MGLLVVFHRQPSFGFSAPSKVFHLFLAGSLFYSNSHMQATIAMAATATYMAKIRPFHALQPHMMAATNASRMTVQTISFRISIRIFHPALPSSLVQLPPRNLQHSVQSPRYRTLSFVVSFFMQCAQHPVIPATIPLITLIRILQSFLPVLIRQRRINITPTVFAQHFRIPVFQRHIAVAVEALAKHFNILHDNTSTAGCGAFWFW